MKKLVLLSFIIILLGACAKKEQPVPRRHAYPRVEAYDTLRTVYTLGERDSFPRPIVLTINSQADVEQTRPQWLDATFPRYGAQLHLSLVPASPEALANRRQRISLNVGGADARTDSYHTGDYQADIVVAPHGVATPVQFLAYNSENLISGAFVLPGNTEPADSLAPIIDLLYNEAFRIINSVRLAPLTSSIYRSAPII